jgi:hypothetical protein
MEMEMEVGSVVYRAGAGAGAGGEGTSGMVMEPEVAHKPGFVDVLWEGAEGARQTSISELSLQPVSVSVSESAPETVTGTGTGTAPVVVAGAGGAGTGTSPRSRISVEEVRMNLELMSIVDPELCELKEIIDLDTMSSEQLEQFNQLLASTQDPASNGTDYKLPEIEISTDFPESSILKYFGQRPEAPFAR